MYIEPTNRYYNNSGQECVQRANFLLLLEEENATGTGNNVFAVVRKVALQQFGPWMTGNANIGGKWIMVSGAYGHDGLPKRVDKLPVDAVKLPDDLYEAWAHGGGWNGAGSEREAMTAWAKETFK